jgi:hypothetical protein
MTEEEPKRLIEKLEKAEIDANQLEDMVKYASYNNKQVAAWCEDWKRGLYH